MDLVQGWLIEDSKKEIPIVHKGRKNVFSVNSSSRCFWVVACGAWGVGRSSTSWLIAGSGGEIPTAHTDRKIIFTATLLVNSYDSPGP